MVSELKSIEKYVSIGIIYVSDCILYLFDTRISHRKPYFETFYINNLYMVKSGKQTFPAPKGDYVTTIQILNSTRIRLKAASRVVTRLMMIK